VVYRHLRLYTGWDTRVGTMVGIPVSVPWGMLEGTMVGMLEGHHGGHAREAPWWVDSLASHGG